VERLDIKRSLFEKVDTLRKPERWLLPIPQGFPFIWCRKGAATIFNGIFAVHFFNPPRYLRLFEVIPA
jgi:3-hydroxyacyl-CoA dehydrogenase